MISPKRYFSCDFETTVFKGQTFTEVWASASVELFTEDVQIFHSIDEQFEYFRNIKENICCYYHNLKFDGNFWLSFLMTKLGYKQAYIKHEGKAEEYEWIEDKYMPANSFKYSISDMGQWYSITIKTNGHYIFIRDSLKLLPFSVKQIGSSFKTKHRKLDMEYEGFRYAGCEITDEEKKYIANDVLVVKEALEIMFTQGHKKLTIGSCCLSEFHSILGEFDYKQFFPNLTEIELDQSIHTYANVDQWIRQSYRGGWCYLVKGKENKIYHNGTTADVNSLYPSMMSSESGNEYPIGKPAFWHGDFIPEEAKKKNRYFFIRIRTRFYLKKGYLPFIQIKSDHHYKGTESLETSDIYDPKTDKYYTYYYDHRDEYHEALVELTLTQTDWYLIQEHYDLVDCTIIDGCYFNTMSGIFDDYINKYKKIKQENTGALRQLAKLFLNNLYGKLATSTASPFKIAYVKEDQSIGFMSIPSNDKKPVYIPCGSAITSYARNFTIRAAQKNYHGVHERGFIYADTDSIHCDLAPEEIQGITVDPVEFCCWKLESCWDEAIFTRQKTYIEHVTHEDLKPIDNPYYSVRCAGMPQKCKDLFVKSLSDVSEEELKDCTEEERKFLSKKRTIKDFKIGLLVPDKLLPKRIKGGVILQETTYQMR